MSDVEKSFTFLHESIPKWLNDLGDIEQKVASMQSEISKIPISKSPQMRRRTGSMESLREGHMNTIPEERSTPAATQQNSSEYTRKRKAPSGLSGHASGPAKFRSRNMIVVQYDGEIQKSFEMMVRNIGTGRNLLRKAKMAARMEAMAAMAADSSSEDEGDDAMLSKIGYRHRPGAGGFRSTRARAAARGFDSGPNAAPEVFDLTDKELENAQALCETGAHQSLRDGDCRRELRGVKKHFESVFEIAKKETAKYTAKKEEPTPAPVPNPSSLSVAAHRKPGIINLPTPPPDPSKPIEIEVDDEMEEDFVMPPVRLTSRV